MSVRLPLDHPRRTTAQTPTDGGRRHALGSHPQPAGPGISNSSLRGRFQPHREPGNGREEMDAQPDPGQNDFRRNFPPTHRISAQRRSTRSRPVAGQPTRTANATQPAKIHRHANHTLRHLQPIRSPTTRRALNTLGPDTRRRLRLPRLDATTQCTDTLDLSNLHAPRRPLRRLAHDVPLQAAEARGAAGWDRVSEQSFFRVREREPLSQALLHQIFFSVRIYSSSRQTRRDRFPWPRYRDEYGHDEE